MKWMERPCEPSSNTLQITNSNSENWKDSIWREIIWPILTFARSASIREPEPITTFRFLVWRVGWTEMEWWSDNHITELGLLQLCILLEEGYLPNLIEVDVDNNNLDPSSLGYRTLMSLLQKNMEATANESSVKIVTTYQLSDQHLSINSKVILQMFTKLTAKWNQLSRQMKFM